MEFSIDKWAIVITNKVKRETTEGNKLPNQGRIREKERYKYFHIFEVDTIKNTDLKEKLSNGYFRMTRRRLETRLCSRSLIKRIYSKVIYLLIYSVSFLICTRDILKNLGQWARKLMTIHRPYTPEMIPTVNACKKEKKKEGSILNNTEDTAEEAIKVLEMYTKRVQKKSTQSYERPFTIAQTCKKCITQGQIEKRIL